MHMVKASAMQNQSTNALLSGLVAAVARSFDRRAKVAVSQLSGGMKN
jgi:hypothetical protein